MLASKNALTSQDQRARRVGDASGLGFENEYGGDSGTNKTSLGDNRLATQIQPNDEIELVESALGLVITTAPLRRTPVNLRATARRAIRDAGVPVWQKLLQNLRESCETNPLNQCPIYQVTAGIGNSPVVALKHYAMMRPGDVLAIPHLLYHSK